MHNEVTGQVREVAVQDLFFSTTDRKGVIDGSNAVFCHYAQYSMDQLIGAPHNIIRHPGMPAGVFRIMWDLLLSGQPMAGYVANLANDGATYWVFATITPLGDGFLSVRQRPCRMDLQAAASGLYEQVRPVEEHAREHGSSRADAALLGRELLAEGVAGLGLASYQDFIRMAVPAEVSARRALSSWTDPDPRDPSSGFAKDMLDAAIAVDRSLDSQMHGLDDLEALSGRLAEALQLSEASMAQLREAMEAASAASEAVASTEPVLGKVMRPLSATSAWLYEHVAAVGRTIVEVRGRIAELRLRTALARLHDETLGEFAREMATGLAPDRAPVYIRQLATALEETAAAAALETHLTNESLRQLALDLGEIDSRMQDLQRDLATWRLLVPRYGLSRQLDPYTGPIDRQLAAGLRLVGQVRGLATECVAMARPFDARPLDAAVAAVGRARAAIAG